MPINIVADTSDLCDQTYRDLLVSDYTSETLNGTLHLLWTVIGKSVPKTRPEWYRVLEYSERGRTSANEIEEIPVNRIRDLASMMPERLKVPSKFSDGSSSRATWQAQRTWTYLILKSLARVTGEVGFFRDIQSLLFLNAAHYLLPKLKSQGLTPEHDCLVAGMYVHLIGWSNYVAQFCFLRAQLADYLGHKRERLNLQHASFMLTPPSDHSYLTKAQSYCCDLIEMGQYKKVDKVLGYLDRTAPPQYQEEIGVMRQEMREAMIGHTY